MANIPQILLDDMLHLVPVLNITEKKRGIFNISMLNS